MNLSEAIDAYLKFERYVRDVAESSAGLYRWHLDDFARRGGASRGLAEAARAVEPYLVRLGERGVAPSTLVKAKTVLRSFGRWAVERGHVPSWPLIYSKIRGARRSPQIWLTREEVAELLAAAGRRPDHGARDRALLATLYYCGLRVAEACRLRLEDLDAKAGTLRVQGKGGKISWVPMPHRLQLILGAYVAVRPEAELLFPSLARFSRRPGQLDCWRVNKIMREAARAAGISKHVSSHALRRSAAQHMRRDLDEAAPLEDVQAFLRHAQITTTMIYLEERRLEAVRPWAEKL